VATAVMLRMRSSNTLRFGLALALFAMALALALFALPAQASKVVLSSFGSPGGGLGQFSALNSPRGIAVNTNGNGGVPAGTVYVADFNNQRIDQFTATGAPIRAWGNKVVASGQHLAAAASAVQSLTVTATGGKYKLKFSGSETGELNFNTSATEIQTALRALPSIGGPGANTNVTVTGTGPYTITFGSTLVNSPEPPITVESGPAVPLTGGTATISVVNPGATGFTICEAVSSPADVCQAGTGSVLAGGMTGPTGVAVDQTSGNVYVTEQNNRRVSEYTATGVWIATWGLDVVKFGQDNAGTGFEICKANSNPVDICQIGAAGGVGGAFEAAFQSGIAVNPTSHNVLVADQGNNRVQEFSSSGQFIQAFGFNVDSINPSTGFEVCTTSCQKGAGGNAVGQFGSATGASRLAVDTADNVYVVDFVNQRVQKFIPGGGTYATSVFGPSGPAATPFAVAIDPTNNRVLIGREATGGTSEMRVEEYSPTGVLLDTHGVGGKVSEGAASSAVSGNVAFNPTSGNIYLDAISSSPKVHILNEVPPPPKPKILPATEITATSAKLNGEVFVPLPGGENFDTKYHFEYTTGGGDWVSAPVPDGNVGNDAGIPHKVELPVSGLEPSSKYFVRLAATTSSTVRSDETSFITGAEVPAVSATHVEEVKETEANLTALVNPRHLATTYHFEWTTGKHWEETHSYDHRVPAFERAVGSGGTPVVAQDTISGLEPNSPYHFRVVATNSAGPPANGPDFEFFTRMPLNKFSLPDDRGAELVSPADKRPSAVVGTVGADDLTFYARASEGGDSFIYPLINGIEGATSGGLLRQVADRTSTGWQSAQLSPPSLVPPFVDGLGLVKPSKVLLASPDLSCGLVETRDPLTTDTPTFDVEQEVVNLYVWRRDGGYELVTNRLPLNFSSPGYVSGLFYDQFDMADDCSHVFFRSAYQFLSGSSGLYEWEEGELRDGGVRPDGSALAGVSAATETVVGGETDGTLTTRWNAVTPEGALFFTAVSNAGTDSGKRAVFLREDGGGSVIDVSQSETGVPANGARFEGASMDGSHVFFRANYGIANTSSVGATTGICASTDQTSLETIGNEPCDLYDYDIATEELTDLSADPNGAGVVGVVAIDEDGSHVYFAALGQLISGKGKTSAENQVSRSANIYLAHDGQLSYVTNLAQHVSPGEGDLLQASPNAPASSALLRNAPKWSATTSGDGSKLLFTSASKSITGYDSGGPQEAYLYSDGPANAGMIACVSCRPNGQPSKGSQAGQSPLAGGGEGFFYGRQARPVVMSDDGRRIFFNSKDVLAPGATSGAQNVYEWEDGNVYFLAIAKPSAGSGMAGYFDASVSGDHVFIATSEKLAPQDIDNVSDVYDLSVGGGFPAAVVPHECDPAADECQGIPTPQPPAVTAPPSTDFHGAGNSPSETKKCHKGRVLRHGKCMKKPGKHKNAHKKKAGNSGSARTANSNRGGAK
jgi:hypothetical protein